VTALVIELQSAAYDEKKPVSALLRLALAVGSKLGLTEIEEWLRAELNGYVVKNSIDKDIPSYRIVGARLKGLNPHTGWIPIEFADQKVRAMVSSIPVLQPASELEHLISGDTDHLTMDVPLALKQLLWKSNGFQFQIAQHISRSQVVGILDTVRSRVLDFALELERRGIMGEGKSFTQSERSDAKSIQYNIHNVGVLGDVSGQATVTASQTTTIIDLKRTEGVVREIEKFLPQLPDDVRSNATKTIADVRQELAKPQPDQSRVQKLLKSLQRVAEGAGGGLVASGIASLISTLF
jgi:hypothetical protein